jgi:hypothetical protein
MEFIEFLLWMATGYVIIRLISAAKPSATASADQQLMEKISRITHVVAAEQHDNQYYWYDRDSGEFLAQGYTLEDIVGVLKIRFSDHFFYLETDHLLYGPDWKPKSLNTEQPEVLDISNG